MPQASKYHWTINFVNFEYIRLENAEIITLRILRKSKTISDKSMCV